MKAAGLEVKAHGKGLWSKVKALSLIKPLHFGSSYLVIRWLCSAANELQRVCTTTSYLLYTSL